MMKNLFYSLLLIAVPFILQAQSYGFLSDEAYAYNLYINNDYEGGIAYGAYINNTKSNTFTQYGLYSSVWNDGSGQAYSVYGYCNSLGTANAYAGYFLGSYGSNVPTGYGIYASCSGAANNYAGRFNGTTLVENGSLMVNSDGLAGSGNIIVREQSANTYARISMYGSENGPDNGDAYWDIAARVPNATNTAAKLNMWYHDGTTGTNIATFDGETRRVGVNVLSPGALLDVQGKTDNTENLVNATVNYVGTSDIRAIYGTSTPNATGGYGYGVYGIGGWRGGNFVGQGAEYTGTAYGIYASATSSGTTTGTRYGVYATTSGTTTGNEYSVYAIGDAYCSGGSWTTSDRALKEDVKPLNNSLNLVKKLKPTTYNYKHEGKLEEMNLPTERQYGFIAQELEQVVPELVRDVDFEFNVNTEARDDNYTETFKGVRYDGLIPILTGAIQEQQSIIEEQNTKIESLEQRLAALENALMGQSLQSKDEGSPQIQNILDDSKARLEQNTPNPFYNKTVIQYFLPENSRDAQIQISNVEGKIVKTFPLSTSGFGTITVNGGELAAGTYFYTLNIANATIATKQMILTK
ncbi:MAG: tail fiber domain-containing protein [Chitinophagales bacterium]|nr:tail fiber domain-containing protein [Chitinophagales bacterium]